MPLLNAFDLLTAANDSPPSAVTVLFGDDPMLRSWTLRKLLGLDAAEEDRPDSIDLDGELAEWKDVRDELQTGSLFSMGQPRSIVVRDADKFVSKYRAELEAYVAKPSSAGLLLLELKSFPGNTRLYKAINKTHLLVQCAIPTGSGRSTKPDLNKLKSFLCGFVAARHQCKLQKGAAETLVELSGTSLGLLDTDIAKLAVCVERGAPVTDDMVRKFVGGWRSKTTWEIIDAATEGNSGEALRQLDHLIASGEKAFALLPQISWSLRRLGLAAAAIDYAEKSGRRISLSDALQQAGFRPFDMKKAEAHLRKIGRPRAQRMLGWLLDADLKLKGTHSTDDRARWVLEELFLKMAS
ncbi:DNA polymerase III subunit delta [Rosistilla oblonga]|uniref:DNA polymerase III subunit delta n=1 Tax=Rosistilla oblonga TaxID=2527990 RepID=UPI003A96A277